MALISLKSYLFLQPPTSRYSPVPTRRSWDSIEHGLSSDIDPSHVSPNEKETEEKTSIQVSGVKVSSRIIADATIGLSDGLTVPFALTAGLSTLGDTNVVIYGGLAELIAGSISMGIGGYLAAQSEAAGYRAAFCETKGIVVNRPEQAVEMVKIALKDYGFSTGTMEEMISTLLASPDDMIEFLMRFHHTLKQDDHIGSRALVSGLTISAAYFFGGLIPLLPYLLFSSTRVAFTVSVVVMILTLFTFGWVKTALLAERNIFVCLKNGLQMVVMGSVAAGAAMGCVKAIDG